MGISNSWIAVQGWTRDQALAQLGLEADHEIEGWPDRQLAIADLPEGWLLFLTDNLEEAFDPRFTELSAPGPAVACSIDEHVMFNEARGYRDGSEIWRVTHDPDGARSLYHLDVGGELPPAFEEIRRTAIAAQDAEGGEDAGVDLIFDVPTELAKSICGFKHDDEWPQDLIFTSLLRPRAERGSDTARSARPDGPGFFHRLFGRR